MYGGALFPKFPVFYIRSAIIIAFWAGVSLGAHNAFVLAFGFTVDNTFSIFSQVHGYIQLMGWVGLFIMGISIHFLPRLFNFQKKYKLYIKPIYILMIIGLLLRYVFHSMLPYTQETLWYDIVASIIILSTIFVLMSIMLYVRLLLSILLSKKSDERFPKKDIKYFVLMSVFGWVIYGSGAVFLSSKMFLTKQIFFDYNSNILLTDLFINFTIIPICFGIGSRVIPLFLRLKINDFDIKKFSLIYLSVLTALFSSKLYLMINPLNNIHVIEISYFGLSIIKNLLFVWFIYKLNIFSRKRAVVNQFLIERNLLKSTLKYGEFGTFIGIVKSAFFWLALAIFFEILSNFGLIFNIPFDIREDGIRHLWLAGFTSLLIVGLGIKMVPPMTGNKIALNQKVILSLMLIMNFSVFSRVLFLIIPRSILNIFPSGGTIAMHLFGTSGIFFLFGLVIFYYLLKPALVSK